jgi:hypothetical protein
MNTEITTYLHAPQSITKFADLLRHTLKVY